MDVNTLGKIMVIVPHQDDEILMCAGILEQAAVNGQDVRVVMATNGDYRDEDGSIGRERLRETLAGLAVLGICPEQVEFLGYADTGMPEENSFLYGLYTEKEGERVHASHCSVQTYGLESKPDRHYEVHGVHAPYTRNQIIGDLEEALSDFRPDTVFTTSEFDSHGDHSGLYLLLREVLRGWKAKERALPALYTGIVHSRAGDENWPEREKLVDYTCPAGFEDTSSLKWADRVRFPVPEDMRGETEAGNRKWLALSKHVTALKPDAVDFLYSFIKSEEIFWKVQDEELHSMEWNKRPIYPVEPWTITETEFSPEYNYRNETTFSLSNGYIGTRGTLEEGYDFSVDEGLEGNFINGFYESGHIRYGEWNYGFPTESQSLLNVPDCKTIRLFLGGEELDIRAGKVREWKRCLHMDRGVLKRRLVWTSPGGKTVEINTKRLVSWNHKNLMEIWYQVTPLDFDGEITFVSELRADVENHTRKTNPLVDYGPFGRHLEPVKLEARGGLLFYQGRTVNSRLSMACGCAHTLKAGNSQSCANPHVETAVREDLLQGEIRYTVKAEKGRAVVLEKQIAYASSVDMEEERLRVVVESVLCDAGQRGWEAEEAAQSASLQKAWETADVVIHEDEALQQGIRFNMFHILQSASRDGLHGMGAKGLSGEGYEGHYFWDTEMYVIPVLVYTNPELAKALLSYRYRTLGAARERARVLGHEKGALYPWRTINGDEASTYYPLGTAQYHINADIAYAFKLYVDVTGDLEFLKTMAAEVLVETARVWADVGCVADSKDGRYCICAVTGPDEYNAIVDNNFYTNLMARENIRDAKWALEELRRLDEAAYINLAERLDFREEETNLWDQIIERMYFPYDEKRQVYPLDDGFMQRKPWDESKIPLEKRHLLYENYHPLFIFRQRMSKQADAILGMYLHSGFFSLEELRRNYDFYQEVTLHHSSLSTCIFGILASRIGYDGEAYEYFSRSARMDLDDYHDNFYAGIHAANMAGTWQAIINGFAGLRVNQGVLELNPMTPAGWKGYECQIWYRQSRLRICVEKTRATVTLMEGGEAAIRLYGTDRLLKKEGDQIAEGTESRIL